MSIRGKLGELKRSLEPSRNEWPEGKRIRAAIKQYEKSTGKHFDLQNPKTFTEKIIWYKLFYDRPDLIRVVDKYLFKDYIRERLGEGYTIPLYGVWDNISNLRRDWAQLPEEFCFKSTLMSDGRGIRMIHHKSQENLDALCAEAARWLKPYNTLVNSYCRAYYHGKPRLLAEKYESQIEGQLYDYKVFCFGGVPDCFYVATDHFPGQLSHISFYDLNWNRLNVQYGNHPHCAVEKPRHFDEMLRIAKILSEGFPYLRVDFFDTADKLYLSELTLYPGGGLTSIQPEEFNRALGDKFILPEMQM